MTGNSANRSQSWLLGLCATLLVAGICGGFGLAFSISGRLAKVETKLDMLEDTIQNGMGDRYRRTEHDVYADSVRSRLERLERYHER